MSSIVSKNDVIEKRGNEWVLLSKDKTKVLGRFNTKKAAEKRERQIQFFKSRSDAAPRRPSLSPPLHLERDYQKKLRKIVRNIADVIRDRVIPRLPYFIEQAESFRPTNDARFDDLASDIEDLFRSTRIEISERYPDYQIERIAESSAMTVNNWNKAKVTEILRRGLGVDPFIAEPWLAQELNVFVSNSVNLIKSNNAEFLSSTERIVYDGVRRGIRNEEIAKQILGRSKDELGRVSAFRKAKNRANLIARDQVNKLNGNLTRLRQREAGVKRYIWRNVGDSRVRDRHENSGFGGNVYTWEKGAPGNIHPGDEIQCRCWAEPVLEDLLNGE